MDMVASGLWAQPLGLADGQNPSIPGSPAAVTGDLRPPVLVPPLAPHRWVFLLNIVI